MVRLYRAGLRVAEVIALRAKDVDLQEGVIRVLCGKGGASRTVGLDAGACALVQRWIECRKSIGLNSTQALFCTLKGESLDSSYVRHLVKRLGRRAGLEKRVHPHGLRHSFAFELSQEGVPVAEIQRLLGHKDLGVTAAYLAHIAPHDLVERIRNREAWGEGL